MTLLKKYQGKLGGEKLPAGMNFAQVLVDLTEVVSSVLGHKGGQISQDALQWKASMIKNIQANYRAVNAEYKSMVAREAANTLTASFMMGL